MSIILSHFPHKLLQHQAGNSTFNADCDLFKLLVLHTYRKEALWSDIGSCRLVFWRRKRKCMDPQSWQNPWVQVINVMQSRQTHGYGDIETQTPYTHNLMYSPITDVYNIGLGVIQETSKQYVIQLNVPHAAEKFLNLNRLESVLYNNPDLASLPRTSTVDIMQTLFICTGCDYVS